MAKNSSNDNNNSSSTETTHKNQPEKEVNIPKPDLSAKDVKEQFPSLLMANFAKAAYLGKESQKEFEALQKDDLQKNNDLKGWQFLNHQHLKMDKSYFGNTNNEYHFENGGKVFINGKWKDVHSQDGFENIHGSAGAIVAQKGNTLVLSFRGTEEYKIETPENKDKALEQFISLERSLMNLGLQNKYGKNLADHFSGKNKVTNIEFKAVANEIYELLHNDILGRFGLAAAHNKNDKEGFFSRILSSRSETVEALLKSVTFSYDDLPDTDSVGWVDQASHYEKFKPLLDAVKEYAQDSSNGVHKILVTGHSLGANMASWYLSDQQELGVLANKGIDIQGILFATPGIVDIQNKQHKAITDNIIRVEAGRDIVADSTDLVANFMENIGQSNSLKNLSVTQLGKQYNVVIESKDAYKYGKKYAEKSVEIYHKMENYQHFVKQLDDVGFNQDLAFLKAVRYEPIFANNIEHSFRPVLSNFLDWEKNKYSGARIVGDYGAAIRENIVAERYSENDIIIGTNNDDILAGDGDGSKFPTNDIFYLGKGSDIVFGDSSGMAEKISDSTASKWSELLIFKSTDDDGGLETIVYNFKDTILANTDYKDLPTESRVSGDLMQDRGTKWHNVNKAIINLDNSPDTLFDIEQIHFVDKASDKINLLAGANGNDRINGLGGNDYLFGAAGDDTFIETANSGDDRIHGGKGNDTVIYEDVKLTNLAIEDFGLKLSFDDGSTDTLYSVENIVLGDKKYSTSQLITDKFFNENKDQDLLDFYKPIFNYAGYDDDFGVFGTTIHNKQGQIIALDYELREYDNWLNPNDHWYVRVSLGDDLLPDYFYTETGLGTGHSVQVRNAFDETLTYDDSHVKVYLDVEAFNDRAWLDPNEIANANSVYKNYDVTYKDVMYHPWDLSDIAGENFVYGNDHYKQSIEPQLQGLVSGQMEMGFLFQDTGLQALGHFDLIGNEILA